MNPFIAPKPIIHNPYTQRLIKFLNRYGEGEAILNNLVWITTFSESQTNEILSYFLELSCRSQHGSNINNGRYCLQNLPLEWLMKRLEVLAEPLLRLNDEWEYRRLMELYFSLDEKLAKKLARRALVHEDLEIRGAGEDFLE